MEYILIDAQHECQVKVKPIIFSLKYDDYEILYSQKGYSHNYGWSMYGYRF